MLGWFSGEFFYVHIFLTPQLVHFFFFHQRPLAALDTPQRSYCAFACCVYVSCHNLGEEKQEKQEKKKKEGLPMVHKSKRIFLVVLSSPIDGTTT